MAVDPVGIDAARKRFWSTIWDAAVEDAVIELRLDRVKIGPLFAFLTAEEPGNPAANFILGAEMPGALDGGLLEDAIAWLESHGTDFRIPVLSGSPEAAAAEARLLALGQVLNEGPALLGRGLAPLDLPRRPGVTVYEHCHEWEAEGVADSIVDGLGLPSWAVSSFMALCEAGDWHFHTAATRDEILASAAIAVGSDVAMLALAAEPGSSGESCRYGLLAVLERSLAAAAAAGCRSVVVADAGEDPPDEEWTALEAAGFEQVGAWTTWSSPVRAPVG